MTQLIYTIDALEAIAWVQKTSARQEVIGNAWLAFHAEVNAKYPVGDDVQRALAVEDNLVMGFRRMIGDASIPGWQYNQAVNAWVPDILTDDGGSWQRRIDDLPRNDVDVDCTQIGMPSAAHMHLPNGLIMNVTPAVLLAEEGGLVFALWSHREIKPGIDAALVQMERTTGFHWEEMPRSEWYSRVEHFEALHATAQAEIEEAFRALTDDDTDGFATAGGESGTENR